MSVQFSSVQWLSRVQLCDPMSCRTPGLPVHHQLPELTQNHVHQVSDAIQPSHPLLSLLPSIFPSIKVFYNKLVLHFRWPKCWSFCFSFILPINIQGWFPLGLTSLISLLFKGLSRVFSKTTVQKHQFFGTQPSSQFNSHIHT